jgi:hypothetical protein
LCCQFFGVPALDVGVEVGAGFFFAMGTDHTGWFNADRGALSILIRPGHSGEADGVGEIL